MKAKRNRLGTGTPTVFDGDYMCMQRWVSGFDEESHAAPFHKIEHVVDSWRRKYAFDRESEDLGPFEEVFGDRVDGLREWPATDALVQAFARADPYGHDDVRWVLFTDGDRGDRGTVACLPDELPRDAATDRDTSASYGHASGRRHTEWYYTNAYLHYLRGY